MWFSLSGSYVCEIKTSEIAHVYMSTVESVVIVTCEAKMDVIVRVYLTMFYMALI